MKYTIFYSWQAEKQEVTDFIRDSLELCCRDLSSEFNADIAVKDADEGNRGSYNINTAIINGIEESDIVVADLTPTSYGGDSRANPNANALYEYAFACAAKGFERVLAVADISINSPRDMPFDWNHNSIVTLNGTGDINCSTVLKTALHNILSPLLRPTLNDATAVFVSQRIAESFPGVRDLKTYTDPHEIRLHLEAFFKPPIIFGEALDAEGDKTPIWWFRGGSTDAISSFAVMNNGIYLIGSNEFKINSITVYSDSARYDYEYIYVETEPLSPVFPEMTEERINRNVETIGYCDEEYGVVNIDRFQINISRQSYDDGFAEINGEIVPIRGRAQLRCRFLTPYNFVIAAKFSSINCAEFDCQSHELFDDILKGEKSVEDLHKMIMSLPKPRFRGR